MCRTILGLLLPLILASQVWARPATYDEYLALEDDLAAVGSYRREIRRPAPLPFATEAEDLLSAGNEPKKNTKNASGKSDEGGYYKTYGSDADGEKGYLKATFSKGDHGYKNLDTFHKQDGDKYEFEEHTAYGKARAGNKDRHEGKAGSRSGGDHDAAGTRVYEQQADNQGQGDESEAHYTEGGEGQYYGSDYTGHYAEGPEFSSYTGDGGHAENYSEGGGDEGSYQTHSSYSSNGDEGGNYEGSHY